MEHGHGLMLRDALLILGFALFAVLAFRRAGLGATLGYLVAGALLGPQVFALVSGAEQMAVVAELGIVMLLFVVGLELSPARLWRMKSAIFGLGLAQVTACGLAVTATILALTGYTLEAALAIGLPLGLSSTAQVLPMLQSAGRLKTPFGEKAFSILLFQDLSIIPLITIIAAMSRSPDAGEGPAGWVLALMAAGAIIGLILAGRLLIRPLFRLIGGLGERELFVVAALFTVIASAFVMQSLGLSAALGAFIAGVMLADTPYRHELEADIEPFRSILLGLFFVSVGMLLDLGAVAERPLFVVGFAVLLIAIKAAIIFGLGLLMKMTWRAALALGLLLSQGGEFAFVLYTQAQSALLIEAESASIFGAIVTLSMAATPFLMMATARIRREPDGAAEEREAPDNQSASAVVVGYGRFGQSVSQTLRMAGLSVTAIDKKASQIDIAEEFGSKVYYGDGTRLDLLRQAGGGDAQLIMFCIDEAPDAQLIESVKDAFPKAAIYVRGFDRRSVIDLAQSPAEYVMREVFESAVRMARMALEKLEVGEQQIDAAEAKFRSFDAERMQVQIEGGDIYAAQDMTREQQRAMQSEE
ncbi:cation:proton antiporter domain-containing protein [Erythrobacter sp. EC-HK427]|uniref:cation:proton antiporter domain-containing protein n=1 Tax=Erythrobacter sp. EC-HK427 TaxID=2038396 RepID=UPI001254117B|nr:cation:proton antiporter [Erythrobacter sp. EC-HK427]VVS99313.1 Sodium:proton exchanger [Erythrobacter sp. EC-HK427]